MEGSIAESVGVCDRPIEISSLFRPSYFPEQKSDFKISASGRWSPLSFRLSLRGGPKPKVLRE